MKPSHKEKGGREILALAMSKVHLTVRMIASEFAVDGPIIFQMARCKVVAFACGI